MSQSPALLPEGLLVTPEELHKAMTENVYADLSTSPRIIPVCASWFMPNDEAGRTGRGTYEAGRIPKARFFDLDHIKDKNSPYPHMLPSPEVFAEEMGKLGIRKDDYVVVYDTHELGLFSAPRVAWVFRVFGHPNVRILNNFRLWMEKKLPIETGPAEAHVHTEYRPLPDLDLDRVATFEHVRERALSHAKEGSEDFHILDARHPDRYSGKEAEPRPDMPSGHMPGSISVPFVRLLNPETKAMRPADELRAILVEELKIDPSKPIICSCGSGVTACIVDAALDVVGYPREGRKIYDGSWTEWSQRVEPHEHEHLIRKLP